MGKSSINGGFSIAMITNAAIQFSGILNNRQCKHTICITHTYKYIYICIYICIYIYIHNTYTYTYTDNHIYIHNYTHSHTFDTPITIISWHSRQYGVGFATFRVYMYTNIDTIRMNQLYLSLNMQLLTVYVIICMYIIIWYIYIIQVYI
jgi:hypothetical protein